MEKRICHWNGCKTKIEVDTSIEERFSIFNVVGWCKVHQEAFRIYYDLEKKYAKKHHIKLPIGPLSYKKHKKDLHQLRKLAEHRAEQKFK